MPEVNMNIHEGQAFYAHETSINFTPTLMNLDFKSISPRVDPRAKRGPTFVLLHNVVMIDPWHAKQFSEVLNEALKKYEQEFGKIEKSKALQKAEKKQKATKSETATTKEVPHYMG